VGAVITSVGIETLRGIRTGVVEGLGPLSVLVGPNNSGKSTVLDAVLIGAAPEPWKAIAFVVGRRGALEKGVRWLFWRSGESASVVVRTQAGVERRCALTKGGPSFVGGVFTMPDGGTKRFNVGFGDGNQVVTQNGDALPALEGVPEVRMVEPHRGVVQEPLHRLYNRALEAGRIEEVNALLRELLPEGFRQVEISAPEDKPVVYVSYRDGAVPAWLQGDGIQCVLRLGLELAAAPGGVVLLEEPETAQHPRSLRESARTVVAAVQRGVQVILSTHSLDLIDLLRAHLGDDLAKLSVHNLACVEGALSVVRYSGAEVALARDAIGEDLR
jgi:hypothetical protein